MEFKFAERKDQRYTHRNPVTGEWWDDLKGKWVKEPSEEKEIIDDQDRES